MRRGTKAMTVVLALAAPPVFACGYCVEDKVAAAYDHAVVERAFGQRHEVFFLALEFSRPVTRDTDAAIRRAVENIPGVDRGTVRVAAEAGALSLAFDPGRATASGILKAIDRDLSPLGVGTSLLRLEGPSRIASGGR